MLKMTIDNEEVVSDKDITINEEMLSASSTILNNVYPKEWEEDKDYTSRFYYPQDYSKALIQRSYVTQEAEAGTTIQVNGSVTLTDVDTTKNSRVLRLLGQTSQTGTPTPSSPIPVNVVSGDNEINVNGKNLFTLKNIINNTALGIERTINNSVMTLNGTSTGSGQIMSRQTTGIVLPSGTYTISVRRGSGTITPNSKQMAFYFRKPSGTEIKAILVNDFSNTAYYFSSSFALTESTELYVELYCNGAGFVVDNLTLQFQIEKGTSASDFEPYIGNTYNIDLPVENLCNNDNVLGLFLNFTNSTIGEADGSKTMYAKVPKNTDLTVSRATLTNRFRIGLLNEIPQNGGTFSLVYNGDSEQLLSKTINSGNYEYVVVQYTNQGENTNIQIEKGTKANTYTPYGTTPIELCKIGNYQDYIYKDSNKWYLHKEIGKVVFIGADSETWNIDNAVQRTVYTGISTLIKSPTNNDTQLSAFTNLLQTKSFNEVYSSKLQGISCSTGGNLSLHINGVTDTGSLTLESWKNWLSSNNIILYYILATPTNTEITYAELLNQLNGLESR